MYVCSTGWCPPTCLMSTEIVQRNLFHFSLIFPQPPLPPILINSLFIVIRNELLPFFSFVKQAKFRETTVCFTIFRNLQNIFLCEKQKGYFLLPGMFSVARIIRNKISHVFCISKRYETKFRLIFCLEKRFITITKFHLSVSRNMRNFSTVPATHLVLSY